MKKTAKKPLEWFQNEDSLTINLPLSGVSFKKLDFFLSDVFLKINILEKNLIKILDFHGEIDYLSKSNSFLYMNENLEIILQKHEKGLWPCLLIDKYSKEEIIHRREQAIQRKNEAEKEFQKNLNDMKIKYDRFSVSEQMRIESKERQFIENKKKLEKDKAEKDLYESIDESYALKKVKNTTETFEGKDLIKKVKNNDILEEKNAKTDEIFEEINTIFQEKDLIKTKNIEIFDEKELISSQETEEIGEVREIPDPRNQKSVQLKFTEKVYPHLAAREQHLKEPPFPKIKTNGGNNNDSKENVDF